MMHKLNFMPAVDADSLIDLDWQLVSSQSQTQPYAQTAASHLVALHETVASQGLTTEAPSSAGSLAATGSGLALFAGVALAFLLAARRRKRVAAFLSYALLQQHQHANYH